MSDSTGYGPSARLYFDGDEAKYGIWEERMLCYMKTKNLKKTILPGTPTTAEKKEQAYAELANLLDERSLCLVMNDAHDDGRRALEILREHYAGYGEQRVMALYSTLTALHMEDNEDVTGYVIRAEKTATALRTTGEMVSDRLLNAMVMKGLPPSFESFTTNIYASKKIIPFSEFKIALRSFEENRRATKLHQQQQQYHQQKKHDEIMKIQHTSSYQPRYENIQSQRRVEYPHQNNNDMYRQQGDPRFYARNENYNNNNNSNNHNNYNSHYNNNNNNNNNSKWCSLCRNNSHTDRTCRRKSKEDKANMIHDNDDDAIKDGAEHSFVFTVNEENDTFQTSDPCTILVDSGANRHIANDESKFVSFDEDFVPQQHTIKLADGTKLTSIAQRKGTALFSIRDKNGNLRNSYLQDTLLIPSFPDNIFSVRAATKNGSSVHLFHDFGTLLSPNGTEFPIETVGDLYYLNAPLRSRWTAANGRKSKTDYTFSLRFH